MCGVGIVGAVHGRRGWYEMRRLSLQHGDEQLSELLKKWVRESHLRGRRIYDVGVVQQCNR